MIYLHTAGGSDYIHLYNSGILSAAYAGFAFGIFTSADDANSPISIENIGTIAATSTGGPAVGISAQTDGGNGPVSIVNSGDDGRWGIQAVGIFAATHDGNAPIDIVNSGDFVVTAAGNAYGVKAQPSMATVPSAS